MEDYSSYYYNEEYTTRRQSESVFLDRNSAAGLGTLFASIVCITTLISLLFYVGVACKTGLKNLREAKKLRVERREARKYRKMTAYDVHGYSVGGNV